MQPTIKPISEYTRGELAVEILKYIALASILGTAIVLPGSVIILKVFEVKTKKDKRVVDLTLNNLKKSGYYSQKSDNTFALTAKGEERVKNILIDTIHFPVQDEWDGFWRIIMFDIPNTKKKNRDHLTWKLKDVGCELLQKSIYVYPYACKKELAVLTEFYFVAKYVDYIVATSIPQINQKNMIEKFNLIRVSNESVINLVPRL